MTAGHLVQLGKALADVVFRLWLGSDHPAEAITEFAGDVVTSELEGELQSRKARRFFEDIGDDASRVILDTFLAFGGSFDLGAREMITACAIETLKRASIDSSLLARSALDAEKLYLNVVSAAPETANLLSKEEHLLFAKVLRESCECIVAASSALPGFAERNFAELFRQQERIGKDVRAALHELAKLIPTPSDDERRHRQNTIDKLDRVRLHGIKDSWRSRYNLSIAYISLSATTEWSRSASTIQAFAQSGGRLAIRGLAGSGKTTLLQWLAVRTASKTLPPQLSSWSERVPFFIPLREFANRSLPTIPELPMSVAPHHQERQEGTWAQSAFVDGGQKALLLLDGFDELPEDRREVSEEWLTEILNDYPNTFCVVTGRPHAIPRSWLRALRFSQADLQFMSSTDTEEFVRSWHAAVARNAVSTDESTELGELQTRLLNLIRDIPAVRRLATSPLLCALLCALHRDTGAALPQDRAALYQKCCEMLMTRDALRNISGTNYISLRDDHKWLALEDIAYWMILNSLSEVESNRVDSRIERRLRVSQADASAVRRLLVERCGILREPTVGIIDFPHRTFQEYLAARAVLDEDAVGVLIQNGHLENWREVVILAAARARKSVLVTLLNGLLSRSEKESAHASALALLSTECLSIAREPPDEVRDAVNAQLGAIGRPTNVSEAERFSSAGDVAVKHLLYDETLSPDVLVACARALALISSDSALGALEEYARRAAHPLAEELFYGAGYSGDATAYAHRVLPFVNLPALATRGDFYFRCCQYLGALKALTLDDTAFDGAEGERDPVSLSELTSIRDLTDLTLRGCSVLSFEGLASCSNLRRLTLRSIDSEGWASLGALSQLEELACDLGTPIRDAQLAKHVRIVWLPERNEDMLDSRERTQGHVMKPKRYLGYEGFSPGLGAHRRR